MTAEYVHNLFCKYTGGSWWTDIIITNADGEKEFDKTIFSEDNKTASTKGEKSWLIELTEGDVLEIDEEITLTVYNGVSFL